jgi:hypothetical protein
MKISFYFDTYPHQELKYIFPTQTPTKKADNVTRYKVTVEVPDPLDEGCNTELFPEAIKVEDAT